MNTNKTWFDRIIFSVFRFFQIILGIKEQVDMHSKQQRGDLTVSGHNEIEIHLQDLPHRVDVKFKSKPEPPSCDHGHHHHVHGRGHGHHGHGHDHDHLEWKIKRSSRRSYVLVIKWKVHGVREIVYIIS